MSLGRILSALYKKMVVVGGLGWGCGSSSQGFLRTRLLYKAGHVIKGTYKDIYVSEFPKDFLQAFRRIFSCFRTHFGTVLDAICNIYEKERGVRGDAGVGADAEEGFH